MLAQQLVFTDPKSLVLSLCCSGKSSKEGASGHRGIGASGNRTRTRRMPRKPRLAWEQQILTSVRLGRKIEPTPREVRTSAAFHPAPAADARTCLNRPDMSSDPSSSAVPPATPRPSVPHNASAAGDFNILAENSASAKEDCFILVGGLDNRQGSPLQPRPTPSKRSIKSAFP
jgi:hypothetical protein